MADSGIPHPEFARARQLRQAGRLPEALAILDDLARQSPRTAPFRAVRGLTLCNLDRFEEGIRELREAVRLEPRNPDFLCDLGLVLFAAGDAEEAHAQLRRALAFAPGHADVLINLGLVLLARGDAAGAEHAARAALAARPGADAAALNLGYALLAQGRFAEAWPFHNRRPHSTVNLRDPHSPGRVAHRESLPAPSEPVVLHGEQGLGDTLFFLRFAPALRARGNRLAFWGDPRLAPVLSSTGLFEHFLAPESAPNPDFATLWVGDLPGMLGAADPATFPPPLPIPGDTKRRDALREHFAALGPPPFVGLTWRAGLGRSGRIALAKSIPPEDLGSALHGMRGTFISMQRGPAPGEIPRLAQALGAPVHDGASLNERLDDALAAMQVLDAYVAVSNTNVHLRAAAGRAARVLVPWPPEWRWAGEGAGSPWFPGMEVYRQGPERDWSAALQRLRGGLVGAAGEAPA